MLHPCPPYYLPGTAQFGNGRLPVWLDAGNWRDRPYAFLIGLVGPIFAFIGSNCAVHMAEEVKNAAVVIPRVILLSNAINGTLGFATLIALLLCMSPPESAIGQVLETDLGSPFIQVFLDATRSVPASAVMASLILVLGISALAGNLATASRMFWSFSRDLGLPFSRQLSRVNKRTSVPVNAVVTSTVLSAILQLIGIASPIAFNDIISITVTALFASYLLSISLLFWRRASRGISNAEVDCESNNTINNPLIIAFTFAFWPPSQPVTAVTMNCACLVYGTVVIFSIGWYSMYAHRDYNGPIVDITPDGLTDSRNQPTAAWYNQKSNVKAKSNSTSS